MPRTAFWMQFSDRTWACAWVPTEQEARDLATAQGKNVVLVSTLPYPARPRLDDASSWDAEKDHCPSFCYRPADCKGKTSCPQRPSCTS